MPLKVIPNRKKGVRRPEIQSTSKMPTKVEQEIHSSSRGAFSSPRMGGAIVSMPILTATPSNKKPSREVLIRPKTVTPLNFDSNGKAPSWEDYDEGVFGAVNKALRSMDYSTSSFMDEGHHNYAVDSSYDEDEEMPMDEQKMHSSMKLSTQTACRSFDSDKSALISSPPNNSPPVRTNVTKITTALEANSSERPSGLTLEERMLWDAIQSTVINASKRPRDDAATPDLQKRLLESEALVEKLNKELTVLLSNQKTIRNTPPPPPPPLLPPPVAAAPDTSAITRINQLEEQLRESRAAIKQRDNEHDAEVRAIQRVLAEMSTEREEETQVLNDTIATLSVKVDQLEEEKQAWQSKCEATVQPSMMEPISSDSVATSAEPHDSSSKKYEDEIQQLKTTIKDLQSEKLSTQKDLERKTRHSMVLERELKVVKAQRKNVEGGKGQTDSDSPNPQVEALKVELEQVKERNQKLTLELEAVNKERKTRRKTVGSMTPPRRDITSHADVDSVVSEMSAEDVESLHKTLCETTSSLENAKKIIASLENANGSMAVDLRAKLKVKEEELAAVQKEAAERKRRLDSLATELRDLQKKQDDVDRLGAQSRTQIVRHKALMGLLEKSVSSLQAASAVHEVTTASGEPDQANVEQISDVLNDAMVAIRTSLELSEQYIDEFDDDATAFTDGEVSSEVGRQVDSIIKNDREALAKNLQNELEQKRIAVRRLEEALKKQNEEIRRLRHEQKSSGDNQQLLAEIKSLRQKCSTNMELLAKKERELSVLRSSLKVDDNDAGYISDDNTEGEDENDTSMSSASARTNGYGPAQQTEAIATIMAAGGGGSLSDQPPESKNELLKAIREKERAAKDLKAERESLANAKLIISSLEKANKSMMEDLRSRLQDSNVAISSLLDKSVEHEKNSDILRKEVDKLKKEKETLENKLQKYAPDFVEADKSRDDSVVSLAEEKKDSL